METAYTTFLLNSGGRRSRVKGCEEVTLEAKGEKEGRVT